MSTMFDTQKENSLAGVDLSRKGSVDEPIQPLISFINQQTDFFTTSSCSGRILIVDNAEDEKVKKKGCKWIMTSHDYVSVEDMLQSVKDIEENAVFKFEPFVLHVQCRSLQDAQTMLQCGVASGFRNSGISVGNKGRFITAIRSTHSLEVPLSCKGKVLVSEEYMSYLVDSANKKMKENLNRIERFFNNVKLSLEEKRKLKEDGVKSQDKTDLSNEKRTRCNQGRVMKYDKARKTDTTTDIVDDTDIYECLGFLEEG